MSDENQKQYELTFILSPELEEKGLNSIEQEIEKEIKNLGGDLKKKGKPEKRSLAYPIKKFQSGYSLVITFLFNPEKLQELFSIFKHKKEMLRYIVTSTPEEPPRTPPPAKALEDRKKAVEDKEKPEPKASRPQAGKLKKLAKEVTREVTEEEIETIKKAEKKKKEKPKEKPKIEDIDKKLDEILGM